MSMLQTHPSSWGMYYIHLSCPSSLSFTQGCFNSFMYCYECKFHKPPGTHHCNMCKTCVVDLDHHCPL